MRMYLDRRLLAFSRQSGASLLGAVLLGASGGVATVAQMWLLAHIIAEVLLSGADIGRVRTSLAMLLVAIAARSVLGWAADVSAARAAATVKHRLRVTLFNHLMDLGPVATGCERTGELTTTLTDGVEALDPYIGRYLPQLALAAVIPLTVAAVVLSRDLLSGAVLLLTAPLIPLFMVLIGHLAEARARRQWLERSRLGAFFLDVIQGLTTLKVLGRSSEYIATIIRVSNAFRESSMAVLRVAFLSALVLELVATLSVAVVAVQIGLLLLAGRLTFAPAFLVLLLAPEVYLPLRRLGTNFHAGLAGVSAAARIFALLDRAPARPTPSAVHAMPQRPSLTLEDISFAYPSSGSAGADVRPALHHVNLRIAAGEKVAVVGPSGAGKSTLAHILLRLVEPDCGTLSADGVTSDTVSADIWRSRFAWVPQRAHLTADTIGANIRLARPDCGDEAVVGAARQALAENFIEELPNTYDTVLGERGATLSGGEAQRIALARAFLADRPILVLDEPAAGLDPRLQVRLDGVLAQLLADRSALIIAHRIPSVLAADRVVVLDQGRVIDQGSHEALLSRCALYRALVHASAGEA